MKSPRPYLMWFIFFLNPLFLIAQPLDITRLNQPVQFDGKVDEAAWNEVSPLPMEMNTPTFGGQPTEKSIVYLAYDDNYLYLAGKLYCSKPEYNRGNTFKRDAQDGTSDYFGLLLDTYNDNENALAFFTSSTAMRWDATVFNDALTETSMNTDWNTFWDVATAVDEEGWSAEIRIPFSSLRFQDKEGEVIMGMTMWRYIAAKNEVDAFPNIPYNWGSMSLWKPSQMKKIRLKGVYSQKPLYLAPYILAGQNQTFDLSNDETTYEKSSKPTFNAGLDMKYSLTSNMILDVTVNTDFAQVEADDQQVNLTRFSLFFPEKRLFFQERASIFDFSFENFNRLFYSRRIGINESRIQPILGGVRLVGRAGKNDLGLLNMQTQSLDSLHSENFGLLRFRRQVFNQFSYIGGIFSNRVDFKGNFNSVYGVDGILRLFGDEYLNVKWAQSFENGKENSFASLDPSRIYINWERRRYDGFAYNLTYSRRGKDYTPGIGFEFRENFSSIDAKFSYGKLGDEKSKVISWRTYLNSVGFRNNSTGIIETANVSLGAETQTKSGWFLNSFLMYNHEFVNDTFALSSHAEVPTGAYDFVNANIVLLTPFQYLVNSFVNISAGSFYDGNLITASAMPFWKVSPHLEVSGFYQYSRARFKARNQLFNSHLARIRLLYMLNTKFSIAGFVQYNNLDEVFSSNIRLRLNPREGNDLYIVYNDQLNGNRTREIPNLPFSSGRTLIIKYTHTFRL